MQQKKEPSVSCAPQKNASGHPSSVAALRGMSTSQSEGKYAPHSPFFFFIKNRVLESLLTIEKTTLTCAAFCDALACENAMLSCSTSLLWTTSIWFSATCYNGRSARLRV